MKKIISLILLVVLMLSVCACTKPSNEIAIQNGEENSVSDNENVSNPSDDLSNSSDNTTLDDALTDDDTPVSNTIDTTDDTNTSDGGNSNTPSNPDTNTPSNDGEQSGDSSLGEDSQAGDESSSGEDAVVEKDPNFDPSKYTYSQYQNMTGAEQEEFFNNFESINAFFDWLNAAKEKEQQESPDKIIGSDGEIAV